MTEEQRVEVSLVNARVTNLGWCFEVVREEVVSNNSLDVHTTGIIVCLIRELLLELGRRYGSKRWLCLFE